MANQLVAEDYLERIAVATELLAGKAEGKNTLEDFGITDAYTKEEIEEKLAAAAETISSKQDTISDLETIRANAALGATALQEHQDISGKANLSGDTFTGTITVPSIKTATGLEIY